MSQLDRNHKQSSDPGKESPASKKLSVADKASIVVISKAFNILALVSSLMILARVLSKTELSLLSFVILSYTTITTLSQLGLSDSIFYFFERVPKESRKSLALLTSKLLFIIGLCCAPILLILGVLAPRWGFEVGNLFFPMMLLAVMELPTAPMPNILIAIDEAKQAAWLTIFNSSILFIATVLPAILGQPLSVIIYSLVGYGALRLLLSAYLFFRNFPGVRGVLPPGMAKAQFKYSIPVGMAQLLWKLNAVVDKYVVATFLPAALFAEYTIGAREIPLLPIIAFSVSSVMMPQFVASYLKGHKQELLSIWFKAIKKVSIIVLPGMVLFVLIAEEFIVVLFGEDYINAAIPFRIYTLILFQRVTSYTAILKAVGETKAITNHAIYQILINLILSIVLVRTLDIAGPPTATLIAAFVSWFYLLLKIRSAVGVKFLDVFPFKFYLKTLLVSVAAGFPVLVIDQFINTSFEFGLIWKVVIFLVSFGVLSTLTGVCQREDWQYLAKILGLGHIKRAIRG